MKMTIVYNDIFNTFQGLLYFGFSSQMLKPISKIPLAVYYVTASTQQQAQILSHLLLKQRLVACCNIVKDVKSIYQWGGKIQSSSEVLMIMKSRQSLLQKIIQLVNKNHSYDVPQVIAMPVLGGSQKYINWVIESTTNASDQL